MLVSLYMCCSFVPLVNRYVSSMGGMTSQGTQVSLQDTLSKAHPLSPSSIGSPPPPHTPTPIPMQAHTPQPMQAHTPQPHPMQAHTPQPMQAHTPIPMQAHTPIALQQQ